MDSLTIKDAIRFEIEEIENEPLRSIFKEELTLFLEFLEHETDMDWHHFLCLVKYIAGEYLYMFEAQDIWGEG